MHQTWYLLGLHCTIRRQQHIFVNARRVNLIPTSNVRLHRTVTSPCDLLQRSQGHLLHATRRSFPNLTTKVRAILGHNATQRYCSSAHSEAGKLIYTGNLGNAVRGVKFFSYSTSLFTCCAMPYMVMKTGLEIHSFALQVAFGGFIGFFTFLTPVILHLLTKGYVLQLYHNEETDMYTAITYNVLLREKKTVFHQSDIKIPDVSRMFTSFYAKKRSMLINPVLFHLPQDYNHLMGYDRPFSFDMDDLKKTDKS